MLKRCQIEAVIPLEMPCGTIIGTLLYLSALICIQVVQELEQHLEEIRNNLHVIQVLLLVMLIKCMALHIWTESGLETREIISRLDKKRNMHLL